jgi:ribonuclease J
MHLTFYGGVNEIGGNKILLEINNKKLFLDFGISFEKRGMFYTDPYLKPGSFKDLLEFNILPHIDGVYKFDYNAPYTHINGVFLSHAHLDHAGYISALREEIPIYCGETTEIILKTLDEMRLPNFETSISGISFNTFRTGDKINIDNEIIVEPIHVDHSVPGAYGFIIYTDKGNIVYTGDFRLHGTKSNLSYDFLEKAKSAKPYLLITEATNIQEAYLFSEPELTEKLNNLIKHTEGLIITQFALTDIDRLRSFYEACKENQRLLVLTTKQAFLLWMLYQKDSYISIPNISDENILIFKKKKKNYSTWENNLFKFFDNVIDTNQLKNIQDKVVLVMPFYDLKELIDISPKGGGLFILSSSEPFNEEMELDYKRLLQWLSYYGLPLYSLHVSGHIMPLDLKEAIKIINPKIVLPVHTQSPLVFRNFFSEFKNTQIKLPKENIKISF